MKKKKITKAQKRRIFWFGFISFFLIAYFFLSAIKYTIKMYDLNNEEKELFTYLDVIREDEAELNNEIDKLQDPEYLARFARENYFYSKDDEYIIRIDEKDEETITENEEDSNLNKYIIAAISTLGILIIYVAKKIK